MFELVGVDDIVCNELCEDPILQAFLGLKRGPEEISQSLSANVEYQPLPVRTNLDSQGQSAVETNLTVITLQELKAQMPS